MNNKINYTFVGSLVVLGFIMFFWFIYWFSQSSSDKDRKNYIIYFKESVFGLSIDSAVKYRGIKVGVVSKLMINPKNDEEIEIIVSILKTTPIKKSTTAQLTSQGITGLSYINLVSDKKDSVFLNIKGSEKYPVIKTIPSFISNIENSFGSVSSKISNTLGQTEILLGGENQKNFSILLKKAASTMDKIDTLLNQKTIRSLQNSINNIEETSANINKMVPNIDNFIIKSIEWEDNINNSFIDIRQSYDGINSTMQKVKKSVANGDFNVKSIMSDLTPTINGAFESLENTLIEIDGIVEQYKRSPSDVLFKQEEIKKGPGESK